VRETSTSVVTSCVVDDAGQEWGERIGGIVPGTTPRQMCRVDQRENYAIRRRRRMRSGCQGLLPGRCVVWSGGSGSLGERNFHIRVRNLLTPFVVDNRNNGPCNASRTPFVVDDGLCTGNSAWLPAIPIIRRRRRMWGCGGCVTGNQCTATCSTIRRRRRGNQCTGHHPRAFDDKQPHPLHCPPFLLPTLPHPRCRGPHIQPHP
jgi:hypothetical protein